MSITVPNDTDSDICLSTRTASTQAVTLAHSSPQFVPHKLAFRPCVDMDAVKAGTILLWRFRPEWQPLLSRDSGYASLSKSEIARAKHYPNAALGKRYVVSRAILREILSGCIGCTAADVPLQDDVDGRVRIEHPTSGLSIAMAFASIWVIVAVARTRICIATNTASQRLDAEVSVAGKSALHVARYDETDPLRSTVRHASLVEAVGTSTLVPDDPTLQHAGPATLLDIPQQGAWHLVDLPMPGVLLASMTAAGPVSTVHAFGWRSLTAQDWPDS
jgi:hypothetical protein